MYQYPIAGFFYFVNFFYHSFLQHALDVQTLGLRLKTARIAKGLKQKEIADQCDVHLNTYSKYERGRQFPDVGFLLKFCEILSVDLAWIINGDKNCRVDQKYSDVHDPSLTTLEGLDTDLLEQVVTYTFDFFGDTLQIIPHDQLAKAISILYEKAINDKQWRKEAGFGKIERNILSLLLDKIRGGNNEKQQSKKVE